MALSLPSVEVIATSASRAARRFPLVLLAAAVAAFSAVILVGATDPDASKLRLFISGALGIPLLFAVATLNETRQWRGAPAISTQAAALLVLAIIGYQWPHWASEERWLRALVFTVAFHLCASFLAFVGRNEPNGFWQFNRVLLIRLLTSALYAAVFFLGLAAALGAIDVLFAAHLGGKTYGRLVIIDAFLFATWFFLGGFPEPLSALDARTDYPDALRKFAQFVLIPLVVVYLLILTTYLGKVLITRLWPSGWIGYLVGFVTVSGVLARLLVYPLEDRPDFAWVRGFTRWYYVALLPSIAMLWLALAKRIGQYGFTERRVFALAAAAWLSGIAIYYIVTRSRNIKLIPMSLCACVLLLSAGPLSAFSISKRDQLGRLERVLVRNGLMKDGKLIRIAAAPPDSDAARITDAVWYLRRVHGEHVLDAWLADSIRTRVAASDTTQNENDLLETHDKLLSEAFGVAIERRNRATLVRTVDSGKELDYQSAIDAVSVVGFQYVTQIGGFRVVEGQFDLGGGAVLKTNADSTVIRVLRNSRELVAVSVDSAVALAMQAGAATKRANGGGAALVSPDESGLRHQPVEISLSGDSASARFVLSQITAQQRGGRWHLIRLNGLLLLSLSGDAPRP